MVMSKLGKAPIFSTDEFVTDLAFHAFLIFRSPKKATIFLTVVLNTQTYLKPSQTSKMECFAKIITVFAKYSILDF